MKSIFFKIVFILTMAFFIYPLQLKAAPSTAIIITPSTTQYSLADGISYNLILTITPHQYTALTGKKLNFAQVLKLKLAQTFLKIHVEKFEPKSQIIALVLCLLVGFLGIHRFYLGYTFVGIVQALTFGGCFIWWIIDIILILTGDLKPKDGSDYFPTFKDM